MTPPGLLIVNADDWGVDRPTTDAIGECFREGRLTSASAMVWMADSDRAARNALELGLPVGLHLNLTSPYTDPGAPAEARERQSRLAAYLRSGRWKRVVPNPRLQRDVSSTIDDQVRRFRELYGREPTHVDGETHVHTWPNVLASRALEAGTRVRLSWTHERGQKPGWKRLVRWTTNSYIRRRFVTTTYFVSIREIEPVFGGQGIERRLDMARRVPVEVMVHPGWEDERAYLLSAGWKRLIEGHRLGSYADLSG